MANAADPARYGAEETGEEEIEVTQSMIDAGLAEFFLYSPRSDSAADSVENIYLAMARAAKQIKKDEKKGGKIGKRAHLAETFAKMRGK